MKITSQFEPFAHEKSPQKYIQNKARQDLLKNSGEQQWVKLYMITAEGQIPKF